MPTLPNPGPTAARLLPWWHLEICGAAAPDPELVAASADALAAGGPIPPVRAAPLPANRNAPFPVEQGAEIVAAVRALIRAGRMPRNQHIPVLFTARLVPATGRARRRADFRSPHRENAA